MTRTRNALLSLALSSLSAAGCDEPATAPEEPTVDARAETAALDPEIAKRLEAEREAIEALRRVVGTLADVPSDTWSTQCPALEGEALLVSFSAALEALGGEPEELGVHERGLAPEYLRGLQGSGRSSDAAVQTALQGQHIAVLRVTGAVDPLVLDDKGQPATFETLHGVTKLELVGGELAAWTYVLERNGEKPVCVVKTRVESSEKLDYKGWGEADAASLKSAADADLAQNLLAAVQEQLDQVGLTLVPTQPERPATR